MLSKCCNAPVWVDKDSIVCKTCNNACEVLTIKDRPEDYQELDIGRPLWGRDNLPPHGDTDTSAEAAELISEKTKTLRAILYRYLLSCGEDGATDDQMSVEAGMELNTQNPRRRELVKLGLARATKMRRKTRRNRNAIVWVATVYDEHT